MVEYKISVNEIGRPYPHYWETCVGSCHAATVLREDVREHIRKAHKECGFQYLRFHGLFDDDMSVYFKGMMGRGPAVVSFYNVDSIFDFLLETGMKPFVEIGFMPEALASGTKTLFHYKANCTPPADYNEWDSFIRQFGEHLLERYGKEEVSQWFFEVWNEPNLGFFFDGTQEDYFELYDHTARTLKSVDECFRVGGPATSVNAWIPEFRNYCESNQVPLDFITTHHYPSDDPLSTAGMNGPGTKAAGMDKEAMEKLMQMSEEERNKFIASLFGNRENKNDRDILAQMTRKAKEEAGDYPLYYTEWNGSKEYDTSYQAAFVTHTLAHNENLVEGYSYWTVSDVFEEMGLNPEPFHNEFGIQTKHGVAKPVYRVFQTLHEAGDRRLNVEGSHPLAEVLALTDGKTVTVLVYNHDLERRAVKTEEICLKLQGSVKSIQKAVIDEDHCNPERLWKEMGSPKYLNKAQVAQLAEASELQYENVPVEEGEEQIVTFTALPESVTILKVTI